MHLFKQYLRSNVTHTHTHDRFAVTKQANLSFS